MENLILLIFIITYIFVAIQNIPGIKIDRPAGVTIGSTLLILTGLLTLEQAYYFIDWNVITFLLGMMVMIAYLEFAGFFGYMAFWLVRISHSTSALLWATIISSALLSAFFVNDTICLLFTPIILKATRYLKLNPIPYLIAIATASNIGSALTITGNPQNMYIGIQSAIPFLRFSLFMLVPVVIGIAMLYVIISLIHRKEINRQPLPPFEARPPELKRALTYKSLGALAVTLVLFIAGLKYPLAALIGASIIFLISRVPPRHALREMDWSVLLFFAGLFIVMGAFEKTGYMTKVLIFARNHVSHNNLSGFLGLSSLAVILSNVVSNVPAVILLKPLISNLGGGERLWLLLAMASTFAGNLTLVGSVANLIVAEKAQSRKVHLGFLSYLKVGLPITVLTILVGAGWIFWMAGK
ncbi:MAG TPA: anion transporter [candidate division Zixibacteria bacterium]|nr:anion transporter [candidate division Zixibacteria bacterium]HBZ01461.1 anion transporter [candidate division Zixibacteria bacterium]